MMDHTVIVETTSTRNDFTKHGLHLSMTVVKRMANMTGKKIKILLTEQRKLPLILPWKDITRTLHKKRIKYILRVIVHPIQIESKVGHQGEKRGYQ